MPRPFFQGSEDLIRKSKSFHSMMDSAPVLNVARDVANEENEEDLEKVFSKLNISQFVAAFVREGIDWESLLLCSKDDLAEAGMDQQV